MSSRRRQPQPKSSSLPQLSRRERQLMDALYRLQRASAAEIQNALPDPPSYTAIRTHLTLLEAKGHVRHESDAGRYIYSPVVPREEMGRRAMESVLKTFFDDSVDLAITALMKRKHAELSHAQIARLQELIAQAKKEGR
ncbi:MAG: BlaI/MecI/CopY family transcriptional regulator [Verrucomicrobiota bacterium]